MKKVTQRSSLGLVSFVTASLILASCALFQAPRTKVEKALEKHDNQLHIPATVHLWGFEGALSPFPGYHFLCWKEGRAAPLALLTTSHSDLEIQRKLEAFGGIAGNNLLQKTWDERHNPSSKAARKVVKGTLIEVSIERGGSSWPLADLIMVPGGLAPEVRLGGHLAYRPSWKSGCILCLVSCPGGRLSNASYTCHDYAQGKATHALTKLGRKVFQDEAQVTVIFETRPSTH